MTIQEVMMTTDITRKALDSCEKTHPTIVTMMKNVCTGCGKSRFVAVLILLSVKRLGTLIPFSL